MMVGMQSVKFLGLLVAAYILVESIVFLARIRLARRNLNLIKPYERINKSGRYQALFMGDSTAVGLGATHPSRTVAGRFGQMFPNMSITNLGTSGLKLAGLESKLPLDATYDLILLQIGANDILRFTSAKQAASKLDNILGLIRGSSHQVAIIHSGNIGAGPLWPWPIKLIYDYRTRVFRRFYQSITAKHGVVYVDIYLSLPRALAREQGRSTYGQDLFHPGDLGYELWFKAILQAIKKAGFKLPTDGRG